MDEHDAVIKQKKLPSLPMSITVDKIMEEYKEAIESGKFPGLHKWVLQLFFIVPFYYFF